MKLRARLAGRRLARTVIVAVTAGVTIAALPAAAFAKGSAGLPGRPRALVGQHRGHRDHAGKRGWPGAEMA